MKNDEPSRKVGRTIGEAGPMANTPKVELWLFSIRVPDSSGWFKTPLLKLNAPQRISAVAGRSTNENCDVAPGLQASNWKRATRLWLPRAPPPRSWATNGHDKIAATRGIRCRAFMVIGNTLPLFAPGAPACCAKKTAHR